MVVTFACKARSVATRQGRVREQPKVSLPGISYILTSSEPLELVVATEVELKLAVAPAVVPTLVRLQVLRDAVRGRVSSNRVHSTYFDTPEGALARSGISIRLRKSGRGWVQTVKAQAIESFTFGPLQRRFELETPLRKPELDVGLLLDSPAGEIIEDRTGAARLTPVFETDFRRTTRMLALGSGTTCRCCIDRGAIRAGGLIAPISEVELELVEGQATDLLDFALHLSEHVELRLESRTKSDRGYKLLDWKMVPGVRFDLPRLDRSMDVVDALGLIAAAGLAQLLANETGIGARKDPEYLHQARIALRRLRLACALRARVDDSESLKAVREQLGCIGRVLGRARDLDVLETELVPAIVAAFPESEGIARFARRIHRLRGAATLEAARTVSDKNYTQTLLRTVRVSVADVPAAVTPPGVDLTDFAAAAIERRFARIRKRGRHFDELDYVALHELRNDIKRLRYMIDCFGSIWRRKPVKRFAKRLSELQTQLGATNDAVMLDSFAKAWRPFVRSADDVEAIGIIRGWAIARASHERRSVSRKWDDFLKTKTFWGGES